MRGTGAQHEMLGTTAFPALGCSSSQGSGESASVPGWAEGSALIIPVDPQDSSECVSGGDALSTPGSSPRSLRSQLLS